MTILLTFFPFRACGLLSWPSVMVLPPSLLKTPTIGQVDFYILVFFIFSLGTHLHTPFTGWDLRQDAFGPRIEFGLPRSNCDKVLVLGSQRTQLLRNKNMEEGSVKELPNG